MILYARTNENYLIPISVPILHLKTESYPTLQFCVDEGRCDGVILYIGECIEGRILELRCVVCVL